jgi:hypothetical protein
VYVTFHYLEKSQQAGFTENLLAKMALELEILVSEDDSAAGNFSNSL